MMKKSEFTYRSGHGRNKPSDTAHDVGKGEPHTTKKDTRSGDLGGPKAAKSKKVQAQD